MSRTEEKLVLPVVTLHRIETTEQELQCPTQLKDGLEQFVLSLPMGGVPVKNGQTRKWKGQSVVSVTVLPHYLVGYSDQNHEKLKLASLMAKNGSGVHEI